MLENPITKEEFQNRLMLDYSVFKNFFPPGKIYTNLTEENKFTIRMNKKVQNSELRCELFIAKKKMVILFWKKKKIVNV